jgi:hypothetical protein
MRTGKQTQAGIKLDPGPARRLKAGPAGGKAQVPLVSYHAKAQRASVGAPSLITCRWTNVTIARSKHGGAGFGSGVL